MKKLKRIGISIIALAAMGMVACGSHSGNSGTVSSEVNTSTVTDKVTGISLDEENIQMDAGYTKQLTATVTPIGTTNNKVVWSSSDESVAVVDQTGLVTAVNLGDAIITATTEVGNYQATCEVSVSGYHRSESVFKNIGKVENNSGYNQTNGNKNFTIDVSNEDYMTITFNRYETMEWGAVNCYYNKDEIKATEFVFEAELVKGKLPNCQFEFAGETDFKFYKRVPLEIGKRSSVSVNLTDMNFVNGWGLIHLEPNNPGDPDDTNKKDTEQVELRIYKMHLIEGDKKAPEKIENLHFDTKSNKVMFNKNTASSEYEIEVYKVEGETKTKLEIDARQTRFKAVQVIPDMAISFTPKPDENFANVPGNYEVRVRGKNSAGEGEWSDVASFTIAGEEENKGYTSKGFLNDGLIEPNQYNGDKTFTSELKEDGYHLTFTGTDTNAWDSYALSFDKNGGYTSLHMEFEVLKGNLTEAQVEFCDWAPAEPEASDGKQQSAIQVTEGKNVVDVEITANLSLGNGQLVLQFARQGAAIGECEILVTSMILSGGTQSAYEAINFLSPSIVPNQYNQDKTFASELKEDGYHLTFTGTDTNAWDSYVLSFNKDGGYTSLHMEFEVLKGNLTEAQVEFCDWAPAEPEASDGKQQSAIQVTEGKNVVDVEITANLSLGNGQLALQFARQGAAIGECEILVTKIALSVANS